MTVHIRALLLVGVVAFAAAIAGCGDSGARPPHASSQGVPSSVRASVKGSAAPVPTAPSCTLLSTRDASVALGTSVAPPQGFVAPATPGFSQLPVSIDSCSWQATGSAQPVRTVALTIATAGSAAAAAREYSSAIAALRANSTSPVTVATASGLGDRAKVLGEWLVVAHRDSVLSLSVSSTTDGQPPRQDVLESLGRKVVAGLRW